MGSISPVEARNIAQGAACEIINGKGNNLSWSVVVGRLDCMIFIHGQYVRTGAILVGFLVMIAALLTSCSTREQQLPTRRLPSGRIVKIQGIVQINFSQGNPTLMLKYQTDLKLRDKDTLRGEADDIWSVFRRDVENGQFKTAIISASEAPRGFIITTSNSYNFVYQKQADGTWKCENDETSK
jgi:hypothetical protein